MKLFIFILLTFSVLNPALVYSSCEEAFLPLTLVQEKAKKSVWAVHSLYGSGTGFFINQNTFVTNFHVVSEALTLNRIDDITLTQKGNPRTLKVKAVKHLSVTYDLVVLEIEGDVSDYLKQGIPPNPKENLFLIGYPNRNFKVIEKIGGIFYKSEFDYAFSGNSSNNAGASGSPVLNTDGEVVGVYHASNANELYAVKIIHLQNLLKQKVEFFKNPKDHLEHSVKEAIEAAKQGSVIAQFHLGYLYFVGHDGVKQDYKKAVYWYKKAAEQGNVIAQGHLGYLYDKGLGVQKNYKEAFNWYKKAAEQGNVIAQYNLGLFYDKGLGVQKNYKEAFNWYKKAAEQGDEDAQNNLGFLYYLGSGVKQDHEKAVYWYEKAADQGHTSAQIILSKLEAS